MSYRLNLRVLVGAISIVLCLLLAVWVRDRIEIILDLHMMLHISAHIRLDRHHIHWLNRI